MSDIKFVDGLIVKAPHEKAPDFVKAGISIKREDLIKWLQAETDEWINLQVKESGKTGKWYAAVDDWKPNQGGGESRPAAVQRKPATNEFDDSDIPF